MVVFTGCGTIAEENLEKVLHVLNIIHGKDDVSFEYRHGAVTLGCFRHDGKFADDKRAHLEDVSRK